MITCKKCQSELGLRTWVQGVGTFFRYGGYWVGRGGSWLVNPANLTVALLPSLALFVYGSIEAHVYGIYHMIC